MEKTDSIKDSITYIENQLQSLEACALLIEEELTGNALKSEERVRPEGCLGRLNTITGRLSMLFTTLTGIKGMIVTESAPTPPKTVR